ncbi:MAG: geranylgeranyl reductase family protein, partial [Firmicutes bacterium]|nr:geranylgeranyl reductase family protein [Bacillota bacterium]
ILLEKEYFPRTKPCAGGVSAAAAKLIGTQIPPEIIEARCNSIRGHYGRKTVFFELQKDFLAVVSREVFDHWLLSLALAAGAEVRQGEKVREIEKGAGVLTVRTASRVYRGRLVIGADGVNSIVARAVRAPFSKRELAFCVCTEIPADYAVVDLWNSIEIYYGPFPMSYGWIFPKRERVSAGLGGWITGLLGIKELFQKFLLERGLATDHRLKGHYIPLGGFNRQLVSDGIILAGDAAGFADPFTGEGIRYAIASGRQAALTAIPLISKGVTLSRQNLSVYERQCYQEFGGGLRKALFIARIFKRFPAAFFGMFFSCREPFQKILEILTGESDYSQMYRWFLCKAPQLLRQWAVQAKNVQ